MPFADTAGMPAAAADSMVIAPFNDIDCTESIARGTKGGIAAIIVEPVQRLVGPLPGFLEGLRALTRELGALLIFDETVTGFRHALGGAQERFGVTPDLACYGKSIGGGLPLAAVAGAKEIMLLCDPREKDQNPNAVYFSGTGFGNPVACAAGHAMLSVLRRGDCYKPFFDRVEGLKASLRDIIERRGARAQVIGEGPMWHLVFTDQPIHDYRSSLAADRERLLKLHFGLIERGVFVRPGGGHYFSMMHTDADVATTLEAIDSIIVEMG